MGVRRNSRETALKIIYQCDIRHDWDVEKMAEEYFIERQPSGKEERIFALALAKGVASEMEFIDQELGRALTNWPVGRLGYLERNILRIGVFELLRQEATPDKVAVDEAVSLAKIYCDKDSSRLINGALQKVMDLKNSKSGPGLPGQKMAV